MAVVSSSTRSEPHATSTDAAAGICFDGEVAVFSGKWDLDEAGEREGHGVFAVDDTGIQTLLLRGDVLDEAEVRHVSCMPHGNSGRQALLEVQSYGPLQRLFRHGLYVVDW